MCKYRVHAGTSKPVDGMVEFVGGEHGLVLVIHSQSIVVTVGIVTRLRSTTGRSGVGLPAGTHSTGLSLGRPGVQVSLVLVHSPVEDIVVLEALADEEITEDLAQVAVVGLVIKPEGASVVEIDRELVREATAEDLGRSGHLLLHDPVVLLLLRGGLKTLPRERATAEVEHDVTERFHVVTAGLLCWTLAYGFSNTVDNVWGKIHTNTKVSVDGGIPGSAGEVLVLSVRNVEMGLGVAVFLGQAKVNDIDLVASLPDAHEEVVGLDVAVDEGLGVDVLDPRDELVGEEQNRLQGELSVAEVEEVLQAGPEEVENHGIVVTFRTKPADKGDSDTTGERLVDAGFVFELGMLGLDALELDGDLLSGDDVGSQVNVTERARSDLASDAVFVTDA